METSWDINTQNDQPSVCVMNVVKHSRASMLWEDTKELSMIRQAVLLVIVDERLPVKNLWSVITWGNIYRSSTLKHCVPQSTKDVFIIITGTVPTTINVQNVSLVTFWDINIPNTQQFVHVKNVGKHSPAMLIWEYIKGQSMKSQNRMLATNVDCFFYLNVLCIVTTWVCTYKPSNQKPWVPVLYLKREETQQLKHPSTSKTT